MLTTKTNPRRSIVGKCLSLIIILSATLLHFEYTQASQAFTSDTAVTSIAPQIILHSVSGADWNSFDFVGKKPLMLIFLGATPHIETFKDTQQTIEAAISRSINRIQAEGVEVVTVVQPRFIPHGEAAKSNEFLAKVQGLNLHYADASTYTLFSASPDGITLVEIDEAGFLRHIEKLPVSNEIGRAIIKAADFQPTIEVGKVAPDFSIKTVAQNNWRLADFRGWKKVLLLFMPKEMTCGCQNPVPSLQAKQLEFDTHDVEVLIISSDEQTTNNLMSSSTTRLDFATDINSNLHYLYYGANDQNLTDALAVLIDKNGVVRNITKSSDPANFESNVIDKIINLDSGGATAQH